MLQIVLEEIHSYKMEHAQQPVLGITMLQMFVQVHVITLSIQLVLRYVLHVLHLW